MSRPYPNRERALHQLARSERRPTHQTWRTTTGSIAEEHEFPGQSLRILAASLPSSEDFARRTRRLRASLPTGAMFGRDARRLFATLPAATSPGGARPS